MSNSVFHGLKRLLIRILIVQFLLGFLPQGFAHLDGITNSTAATSIKHSTNVSSDMRRGEQLARQYCQSCHLFPQPDLLDKATWEKGALPLMGKWLGISKMNLDLRPGRKRVEAAGLFPPSPLLPVPDWEAVCKYYIESAPEKPLPQAARAKIRMELKRFEVVSPDYRFQIPLTTLVEFKQSTNGFQKNLALAENLTRPVEAVFADFNNDGKEDFVVCGFGNYIGRFSWFENLGDNKFREHILFD